MPGSCRRRPPGPPPATPLGGPGAEPPAQELQPHGGRLEVALSGFGAALGLGLGGGRSHSHRTGPQGPGRGQWRPREPGSGRRRGARGPGQAGQGGGCVCVWGPGCGGSRQGGRCPGPLRGRALAGLTTRGCPPVPRGGWGWGREAGAQPLDVVGDRCRDDTRGTRRSSGRPRATALGRTREGKQSREGAGRPTHPGTQRALCMGPGTQATNKSVTPQQWVALSLCTS